MKITNKKEGKNMVIFGLYAGEYKGKRYYRAYVGERLKGPNTLGYKARLVKLTQKTFEQLVDEEDIRLDNREWQPVYDQYGRVTEFK